MSKAIFFDLDNTLVHRNKSISGYSKIFVDEYSAILTDVDAEEVARVIYTQDNGGYLATDTPHATIKDAVSYELHKMFLHSADLTVEEIRDHWISNFPESTIPMRGANDLLRTLSGEGYHLGIISNGAHKSREATARRLESYYHINQLVSSESAGVSKPSSEIFAKSVFNAGFTAAECWFVGDHPINDIDGARRAGMQTIWLQGFHDWPKNIPMPHYSVESLDDVKLVLA